MNNTSLSHTSISISQQSRNKLYIIIVLNNLITKVQNNASGVLLSIIIYSNSIHATACKILSKCVTYLLTYLLALLLT